MSNIMDKARAVLAAADARVETVEHGPFKETVNTWADLSDAVKALRSAGGLPAYDRAAGQGNGWPRVNPETCDGCRYEYYTAGEKVCDDCEDYANWTSKVPPAAGQGCAICHETPEEHERTGTPMISPAAGGQGDALEALKKWLESQISDLVPGQDRTVWVSEVLKKIDTLTKK